MRNRMKKAFTLVEILIVVVILGILAAIVVPQFTNATQDAQVGNLRSQIKQLQNQLELFKARTGAYPDLATAGWDPLITGGYIKAAPKNPVNSNTGVGATPASTNGWHYTVATGEIGAVGYNETTEVLDPND